MFKISCFVAHLADVVLHYMWVLFLSFLNLKGYGVLKG